MCVSCWHVRMEELIVKKCRKCGVCAEKGNRIENDCIFRQRTFFIWKYAILPCAHNKYKPSAHFKRSNESFNLFDFYLFYFSRRFRSLFVLLVSQWKLTVNNLSHFEYKISAAHYRITCIWDEQRNAINLLVLNRIARVFKKSILIKHLLETICDYITDYT